MAFTGLNYNPDGSGIASIDSAAGKSQQMNTFYWLKKAIIEARKEQYFMPLASVVGMPKHYGKTIKCYEYVPLLDDRNVNDQGIDAAGVKMTPGKWAAFNADGKRIVDSTTGEPVEYDDAATARTAAGATGSIRQQGGNLYGSSKDVGTIVGKLPVLGENGGRVNRVGYTRLQREGSIHKFGFFYEWSKESMDFDSDPELQSHLSRELMNGAVQITEAVLQKDLLAEATTVLFAGGVATDDSELTGEVVPADAVAGTPEIPSSVVTYEDLVRLDQILNDNRTPKQTKVITGSRLIDTKTIPSARVMFVGSELVPILRAMKDLHGNPAFIPVQHYAAATTVLNGEIGSIDSFRIVVVPEMQHWAAAGAEVTDNPGFRASVGMDGKEHYDVFPMLVVGDDSFTTIGFQTDGKTVKFQVITKVPGTETADRNDPYGETGFSSIKWFYGILVKRPERLALIKTVAPI